MYQKLSKEAKEEFYRKWVKDIIKNHTLRGMKMHMTRHAKEVYEHTPEDWSASMRNLLDIWDEFHGITPDVQTQLDRLFLKYNKNKKRYTPPPKISS